MELKEIFSIILSLYFLVIMVKIWCHRNILKHTILPGFVMDNNYHNA